MLKYNNLIKEYIFLALSGILLITWRNIGRFLRADLLIDSPEHGEDKKRLRVQVDCAGSNRGLFLGLFVFVAALVCLIVFYVLVQRPRLLASALTLAYSADVALYLLAGCATVVAFFKMQDMLFQSEVGALASAGRQSLDDALIFISLGGVFIYSLCSILAGKNVDAILTAAAASPAPPSSSSSALSSAFAASSPPSPASLASISSGAPFLVVSGLLGLSQAALQSLFTSTGLRRMSYKAIHEREKPGREFVIFLLLTNLAIWVLHMFEHMRTEPVRLQARFFGHLPWAYISQLTLPFLIFYRFHSAVCLSSIWKNAYKFKTR